VGGILGKLVTVPGFTGAYTFDEIKKLLSDIGCCVVQQPQDVAPAEREVRDTASIIGAFHNNSIKAGNCSIIIDKIIVKIKVFSCELKSCQRFAINIMRVASVKGCFWQQH